MPATASAWAYFDTNHTRPNQHFDDQDGTMDGTPTCLKHGLQPRPAIENISGSDESLFDGV
jgi:hypothetical protein